MFNKKMWNLMDGCAEKAQHERLPFFNMNIDQIFNMARKTHQSRRAAPRTTLIQTGKRAGGASYSMLKHNSDNI